MTQSFKLSIQLSSILICISIVTTSCRKNKIIPNRNDKELIVAEPITEKLIKEFLLFERALNLKIIGRQMCGSTYLFQNYTFRLQEGQLINNQYFYNIQRKFVYKDNCGLIIDNYDWIDLNVLYRYSFSDKIAYLYQTINDQNPIELFDFNVNVGDLVELDSSINSIMIIEEVGNITLQGQIFPMVTGKLEGQSTYSSYKIIVVPFAPNPFFIDQELSNYYDIIWDNDDFCAYSLESERYSIMTSTYNDTLIFNSYFWHTH